MTDAPELVLIPRPQTIEVVGSGPSLSTSPVERRVDGLPSQGFEIDISDSAIELRHTDGAGLRYGRALLEQVKSQVTQWPQLTVRDWPDYSVRGFMLDISRGRVPKRQTLDRLVEILELIRVNQLQLYTEHTFAYADHEVVWRDASPMTPGDIHWLDVRCQEAGIELVANQNSFGHMERWLVHDDYRHRAECPDGFTRFGVHRDPSTLAPTQENADFSLKLLEELLPHFTSKKINVGFDETWELGEGASAQAAEERGLGRVYLDHLRRIIDPLLERGYQPQFWGDIISEHPELAAELPEGATAAAWIYQAPRKPRPEHEQAFRDIGLDPDVEFGGFAARSAPFIDAGYPYWVVPGTATWRSLVGRLDNAIDNLIDAAEVGLKSGASGYLVTEWGDQSHVQSLSVAYPPLVFGAAVGWSLEANRELSLAPVLDRYVFGDETGKLSMALDVLGRLWGRMGQDTFNCSPLHAAMTTGLNFVVGEADPDKVAEVISDIESSIADIEASSPSSSDGEAVKNELIAAARLARHGAWRVSRDDGGAAPSVPELKADLAEAMDLHRDAWLARSRPGGMELGLAQLDEIAAQYA